MQMLVQCPESWDDLGLLIMCCDALGFDLLPTSRSDAQTGLVQLAAQSAVAATHPHQQQQQHWRGNKVPGSGGTDFLQAVLSAEMLNHKQC